MKWEGGLEVEEQGETLQLLSGYILFTFHTFLLCLNVKYEISLKTKLFNIYFGNYVPSTCRQK